MDIMFTPNKIEQNLEFAKEINRIKLAISKIKKNLLLDFTN